MYGPLLTCVAASRSSYDAMVKQFNYTSGTEISTVSDFRTAVRRDRNGPEAIAYRAWVQEARPPL